MRSAVNLSLASANSLLSTSTKCLTAYVICCGILAVGQPAQLATTASNDCCRKNGVSKECLGLCHSAATHDDSHVFVGGMLCRYKFEHITKACNRGEAVVGNRTDQAFFAELAARSLTVGCLLLRVWAENTVEAYTGNKTYLSIAQPNDPYQWSNYVGARLPPDRPRERGPALAYKLNSPRHLYDLPLEKVGPLGYLV